MSKMTIIPDLYLDGYSKQWILTDTETAKESYILTMV